MPTHAAESRSLPSRRAVLSGASAALTMTAVPACAAPRVVTGAMVAAQERFAAFAGQRIGLVTNQTGRVGDAHLADLLAATPGIRLAAVFAPEHGFRGLVEAGAKVSDTLDPRTGVPVISLYGANKAPAPAHLATLDVLVFDIQDIGARFYTYISSMGLAMQAAARRGIPFVVLDRSNPLGGHYVSGFVLEPRHSSFVGQYPIPIVHGLTVGELATMIKGERWLDGLDALDLRVVGILGWTRRTRFPATALTWVATSPNIPTFMSALVYPGIGVVGETLVNEGRGTPLPFEQFGTPWLDAEAMASAMATRRLPGVRFEPVRYVPQAIPNVAATPRFRGETVNGVRLHITDVDAYQPLEVGMHVLAELVHAARMRNARLLPDGAMFTAIAGTTRLRAMLEQGAAGGELVAAWRKEVAAFDALRQKYLRYG